MGTLCVDCLKETLTLNINGKQDIVPKKLNDVYMTSVLFVTLNFHLLLETTVEGRESYGVVTLPCFCQAVMLVV